MRIFHPPETAIETALKKLKQDGVIHPDAFLNYKAEGGLRKEVTFRDDDLQYRLGNSPHEEGIVDAALQSLVSLKLIPADASYNKTSFNLFRTEIKQNFRGSWTSITPVMERLMYALTAVKKPRRLVELGSFWGNTLA